MHTKEQQGPEESSKVIGKRKIVQSRMFRWSDKQQPVLVALETYELISCYMHRGTFMLRKSICWSLLVTE